MLGSQKIWDFATDKFNNNRNQENKMIECQMPSASFVLLIDLIQLLDRIVNFAVRFQALISVKIEWNDEILWAVLFYIYFFFHFLWMFAGRGISPTQSNPREKIHPNKEGWQI